MSSEFLFVYGTLRKAMTTVMSAVLTRHCDYVAEGYMHGKLYEVNSYPAAIESSEPHTKVYGELYQIINSALVLPALDAYEECTATFLEPHEYIRKLLTITLFDGSTVTAWVYIFNHDVSRLAPIHSGDYVRYCNAK